MLWTMIRKEWVNNLLELRFLVCATLCIFLAVVSVFVLRADLTAKRADFNTNREIYRKQVEEYDGYSDLQRQGIRVDRPPQNFQVLFYGMEKTLDRTAVISGDYLPGFEGDLNTNPVVLMFPVADLLFIVGVVLSLLAFFISYDAVAGERESGTLKLLLSYSVPRDIVILAKWIGGYLSLALPFLAAMGLSALLVGLSGGVHFTAQDWEAFLISGLVSLLLIAVMFSIGLFVSVRARRSSTAILSLLAVWVLLALVVPNSGPFVAEIFAPVPDVGAVERQIAERIKAASDEFRSMFRGNRRRMRNMSQEERAAFFQEVQQKRADLRRTVNEASEEVISDFEQRLRRQIDVARTLTRLSPVASYAYANTDIGETGVRHQRNLVNGLRTYQRDFARYVEEKIEAEGGGGDGFFGGSQDGEYDIEDMPVFTHRAEELAGRLASRTTDVLLLVVFSVLFFMGAFISFLRTDIT
jgi:ABC-type transport system involved in multi-copper enzyme maturation permease subunit